MTIEQMAQRIWTAALYGMDTYFVALYHTTAKGFLDKVPCLGDLQDSAWCNIMAPE